MSMTKEELRAHLAFAVQDYREGHLTMDKALSQMQVYIDEFAQARRKDGKAWADLYHQQMGQEYTHMVILVQVADPVTEQGKRTGKDYFYDLVAMDQLNMLQFACVRFSCMRMIPVRRGDGTLVDMFKGMYPQWDHSIKPYPEDWWDVKS